MTTSGVATFEFDVARIAELACRRAGYDVEDLTAGHALLARDLLTAILNEWSNDNLIPWAVARSTFQTVANAESVVLPADVIDLMSGVMINDGENSRPLNRISRDDFARIPDKDDRSIPDRYWFWAKVPPTIFLDPIPDDIYTVTYWCVRRLQDVTAAVQTIDAPMRWVQAIIDRLALDMFDSLPAKKRMELLQIRPSLFERSSASEQKIRRSEVDKTSWYPLS